MTHYRTNDWGFRLKREGDNYWLGFINRDKSDLWEVRINKEIYEMLKAYWKRGD